MKPADQRFTECIRTLRGLSVSLNMMATEMEVAKLATEELASKLSIQLDAQAEVVFNAAERLRGEKP